MSVGGAAPGPADDHLGLGGLLAVAKVRVSGSVQVGGHGGGAAAWLRKGGPGSTVWEGRQPCGRGDSRGQGGGGDQGWQGMWSPLQGTALSFTPAIQPSCLARKAGHLS